MKRKPTTAAATIIKARHAMGISQAELSVLLGVHTQTVAKWERGLLEPSPHQRTVVVTMAMGQEKAKLDLKVWLTHNGWVATLAHLFAASYGLWTPDRKLADTPMMAYRP